MLARQNGPQRFADQIFDLAQQIASKVAGFQDRRGPGKTAGNAVTDEFLAPLDREVAKRLGNVCKLQEPVAPGVKYSFDYFIPSEKTAVEIIGKQGSVARQNGTGPNAIKHWVSKNCGFEVRVRGLT